MDLPEPSNDLAQLRAEVEKLRLDLNRVESLTRQLEGARDQLRRSTEGIERRDVIIREARKQIATLSRRLDDAQRQSFEAKKALPSVSQTGSPYDASSSCGEMWSTSPVS